MDGRTQPVYPHLIDLYTLARKRIGEVLGFRSAADRKDEAAGQIFYEEQCEEEYTVYPTTLDVWRFDETGQPHDLTNEPRRLTHGPAEYFDSVLNNLPMAWGIYPPQPTTPLDPSCDFSEAPGYCYSGSWRQDQELMMRAYPTAGDATGAQHEDMHAIDYIGYDASLLPAIVPALSLQWVLPNVVLSGDARTMSDGRREVPPFPVPTQRPEFEANLGLHVLLQLGELGERSAAGFARFEDVRVEVVEGYPEDFEPIPGVEYSGPLEMQEYTLERPPAIMELYFESDGIAGVPFRFDSTCSVDGCQFDPRIGTHGGYRVTGFIDALGDEEHDVDGRLVLELAADEHGVPDPAAGNVFTVGEGSSDSRLFIRDYGAFGLSGSSRR